MSLIIIISLEGLSLVDKRPEYIHGNNIRVLI